MSKPLKPRQLECFIAVAETLNFRQAAERLFMTQPPLSRHIRNLEQQLGVRLFERDTRGVSLTAAGAQFLYDARRLLAAATDTLQKYRALAQQTSDTLRLGVTRVVEVDALQPVLDALAARNPATRITWRADTSLNLIRAVTQGELDAAFVGQPSETGTLALQPCMSDPLMVALPASHPLAGKRRLALRELNAEAVFWFRRERNPAYFDFSRRLFAEAGFAPRFLDEPEDHHVLLGQVAVGAGVALIARSLGSLRRKGVVYRPLLEGERLAIGLGLVYRPLELAPPLALLLQCVRERG